MELAIEVSIAKQSAAERVSGMSENKRSKRPSGPFSLDYNNLQALLIILEQASELDVQVTRKTKSISFFVSFFSNCRVLQNFGDQVGYINISLSVYV